MLFQAGQLRINNTATEYIDSYRVLGYIRNLLGMMPDAKKSRLECEGWFEDKARGGNLDSRDAAEKQRRRKIAGSRKQVLLLRPKFSLCKQQKMFVPGVEFEFLFRRSPTNTFLNGANVAVAGCKIRIPSAELKVRRCKVDPEVYSALLTAAARAATREVRDGDGQYCPTLEKRDTINLRCSVFPANPVCIAGKTRHPTIFCWRNAKSLDFVAFFLQTHLSCIELYENLRLFHFFVILRSYAVSLVITGYIRHTLFGC